MVTETRNEACLDHGFLLLKSGILPEKKKPGGLVIQDFPSVATRQQGALLLDHKKYLDFFLWQSPAKMWLLSKGNLQHELTTGLGVMVYNVVRGLSDTVL